MILFEDKDVENQQFLKLVFVTWLHFNLELCVFSYVEQQNSKKSLQICL